MQTGVELITAERKRQIEKEGWTAEHDDTHARRADLMYAAMAYIEVTREIDGNAWEDDDPPPASWPWDDEWFKPKSPLHNLVRAGGLIAAEIDRRVRAGEQP